VEASATRPSGVEPEDAAPGPGQAQVEVRQCDGRTPLEGMES